MINREPQTPNRILEAAAALFAANGFDGTSIREITRAAGVNVAAVHYHFGSKEAVLRGVTDRVVGPLTARRAELLAAAVADAAPEAPSVEAVVDAVVRADVEILQELQHQGPTLAHFLGRTYSDQTPWIQKMANEQFGEDAHRLFPVLARALPHLPASEIAWRMEQVVAVVVHLFATWPDDGMTAAEAEDAVRRLVAFLAPGLAAPAPANGEEA